jgi:hypothetical protein
MKQCSKCLITKTYEEFNVNKATRDGRGSYCKTCTNEYNRQKYDKSYTRKFPKEKFKDGKRYCTICTEYKDVKNFRKSNMSWCIECTKEKDREKYNPRRVHPEKIKNGLIHCRRCDQYLEEEKFSKQSKGIYSARPYCNDCKKHIGHSHNMKRLGMSVERYIELEKQQDYKCKICGGEDSKRLSVDHDHSCCNSYPACGNCVRGLLCSRCNRALGILNDDIELLQKMIAYLKQN